jgi:excisionase family DNA binding protein
VLHLLHTLHSVQTETVSADSPALLTARQVQEILHVDRSTVYRMAESGRLPAIRVGGQWRFPAQRIQELAVPAPTAPDRRVAQVAVDIAADLLGVMMVVTDMDGRPVTRIANPCAPFIDRAGDPGLLRQCVAEWRRLADEVSLEPRFRLGEVGFECARVFVRSGRQLTGMVLAGGVAPIGVTDSDLYTLTDGDRDRVLRALPRIATAISRSTSDVDARPIADLEEETS